MARRIVTQTPITCFETRDLLAKRLDQEAKMDPRIQQLVHTLDMYGAIDVAKVGDLKAKLLAEGIPERMAVQLIDVKPSTESEFLAVAGSDPAILAKKDKVLQLLKEL